VPTYKGLLGDWTPLDFKDAGKDGRRVVRGVYEICTFQALRERLRCKEIWIVGADKWRNPDEDLPADFEAHRAAHYAALRKPLDPTAFIGQLREEMRSEMAAIDAALPKLAWLEIAERGKSSPIKLTDLDAAPEPRNLRRLKAEVRSRWGTVPLIDMLKEVVLRTGCLSAVTAAAGRGDLAPDVFAERLLLTIYAYSTNTGIRAIAGSAQHGHGEDDIRYVRRRYLTADVARTIAVEIANATFAARAQTVWGAGSTAVASDSTHFGALCGRRTTASQLRGEDADADHACAGLGARAVRAPRGEHHVAARPKVLAPVDELPRHHVIAFLALVHVHLGPLRPRSEVIHPTARPLRGRQAPPDNPGNDLHRFDLVDVQDLNITGLLRHKAIVAAPAVPAQCLE